MVASGNCKLSTRHLVEACKLHKSRRDGGARDEWGPVFGKASAGGRQLSVFPVAQILIGGNRSMNAWSGHGKETVFTAFEATVVGTTCCLGMDFRFRKR